MKKLIKALIKALFIIIGLIIIVIYFLPIPIGLLNAGNIFGIAVGIFFILIGALLDKIIAFWKKKKANKIIITTFCAFAVIFATIFGVTLYNVLYGNAEFVDGDENIIILGCQVKGERPSSPLYNRTMAGVDYLKRNPNTVAILCGGQGSGENISEAECMKRIMLDNGIDESRFFIEDKSTSTNQNIKFAKDILTENNLGYDVVIATSNYHCYRATMIAKSYGLNAKYIPVKTNRYALPTFYTREVFGVWKQVLIN